MFPSLGHQCWSSLGDKTAFQVPRPCWLAIYMLICFCFLKSLMHVCLTYLMLLVLTRYKTVLRAMVSGTTPQSCLRGCLPGQSPQFGSRWRRKQNRFYLESRTPSWAGLWTLSSMPRIYGKDIPTGKPGPWKQEPKGSSSLKEYPNYLCNWIESYILLCLLGYDHRPIDNCPLLTT